MNTQPSDPNPSSPPLTMPGWRGRVHEVIFEADTPLGKAFDVFLMIAILASVGVVMLDSVETYHAIYETPLLIAEIAFTVLFTIEYVLRLICVRKPSRYAFSFFGIVDLLSILPTYLWMIFPGGRSLMVIRSLRLLRVFRIFKLARFLSEAGALREALLTSRAKIIVFLTAILIVVVIMGSAMYIIEGDPESNEGFTSIPQSMYWAIVTMTTVGYGDIAPETPLGKFMAAIIMVLGYTFIIIPTGIISAELARPSGKPITTQHCPDCSREGHDTDAHHCKYCGGKL